MTRKQRITDRAKKARETFYIGSKICPWLATVKYVKNRWLKIGEMIVDLEDDAYEQGKNGQKC